MEKQNTIWNSLSLWVPSLNKKVGRHGTPFFSIFCHSNTFHITQATHHLSKSFFAFLGVLPLVYFLPSEVFVFSFLISSFQNIVVSSLVESLDVFVLP